MSTAKSKLTARERAERTQAAARQRVVERGLVQFRTNEEVMDLLLKVAASKHIPYGVMCRVWIVERLRKEAKGLGHLA